MMLCIYCSGEIWPDGILCHEKPFFGVKYTKVNSEDLSLLTQWFVRTFIIYKSADSPINFELFIRTFNKECGLQ